jgi:lipoprotein-anchoring transpeptidase ErfK/SrfK
MTGQAELDRVAYETPAEMLAERFHMARSFLEQLNPGADFGRPGTTITVVRPGGDENLADVRRIEVDKSANELRAFSADGAEVATYPITVGSNVHPSPNDRLEVLSVAPDPTYHFDPAGRTWGPDESLTIAPGPNNPVGIVWIDLSRDGYGIHGTPEPRLIGKTSSHGCVRLTNWDAHELAGAVSPGTTVVFQ